MKYLIDTNIFINILQRTFSNLSKSQIDIISDSANDLYLSEASYYEMAIKSRSGRNNISNISIETLDADRIRLGIKLLQTQKEYYLGIINVPTVSIGNKAHGDPFDLLILSQAIIEQLPILSTDGYFPKYKHKHLAVVS